MAQAERETEAIAATDYQRRPQSHPVVSLICDSGTRPDATAILARSEAGAGFTVSYKPSDGTGAPTAWLELLANGLTFDIASLGPVPPQPLPECGHLFGLPEGPGFESCEAITIAPGHHIATGKAIVPILRSLALIAADLADLPGVRAVAWRPARAWNEPGYFRSAVRRWCDGGVFPGLGLAALSPLHDGGLMSEGLDLFIGQELLLGSELVPDRAEGTKLALRLMHWLVESGKVSESVSILGPSGEVLRLFPDHHQQILKVTAAS